VCHEDVVQWACDCLMFRTAKHTGMKSSAAAFAHNIIRDKGITTKGCAI
jgi:hypothetical protein